MKKLLHLLIFASCLITLAFIYNAIKSEYWLVNEFEHKGIFRSCKTDTTQCKIHRDGPTVICLGGSTLAVTFAACSFLISMIVLFSDDNFMYVITTSSLLCFFANMYAVKAFEEFAENRVKRREEFWYGWGYDCACYGTYWAFISFKLSLINTHVLPALNQQPAGLYVIRRFRFVRHIQYYLDIRQRRHPRLKHHHQHQQEQLQQQQKQQQQLQQRLRQLQLQQQQIQHDRQRWQHQQQDNLQQLFYR